MNDLTKYNEIRSLVKTGDVIFFSGNSRGSNIIKRVTNSQYSHVGIAVWLSLPPIEEKRLFIIESTTLNDLPDVNGEYRKGVQMLLLSQRIESYDGSIWIAPLCVRLSEFEEQKMMFWLFQQYTKKVDYDTEQAIKSGLDFSAKNWFGKLLNKTLLRWTNNKENMNKLFCSELVTRALQEAGIIDLSINPSEMTPEDVGRFPIYVDKYQII